MADVRTPVAVVVQRRVRPESATAFAVWETRVAERLQNWPGFVTQEAVPPSPPVNVDWTIVQHFTDAEAARGWLQSTDRAALIDEVRDHLVGQEEVHLMAEGGSRPPRTASVIITYEVPADEEAEFLKQQRRIQSVQAKFPGFLRSKIERPIPGVHEDWQIVLSFDSEVHLSGWLDSPERKALIENREQLRARFKITHTNHGFDFWFPGDTGATSDRHAIFKRNLLVLLVLYPLIFLWSYLISEPFIARLGAPSWLALFLGNIVTTQLLGWWVAPAIFKAFDWWTPSEAGFRFQFAGYVLLAVLYALSMALCAFLLHHPL